MPLTITPEEWKTAHHYLDGKPEGTKLTYSAIKGETKLLARPNKDKFYRAIEEHNRIHPGQQFSHTTHSFIRLGGKIYALAQGKTKEAILGAGVRGKVKYLVDEDGKIYSVKIEKDGGLAQEFKILQDRQLSTGTHTVQYLEHAEDSAIYCEKPASYTQMEYLGKSLRTIFNEERVTDEERLRIAIYLCLELDDFHRIRGKSKSKTAYAHRDLKLENITMDAQGRLHLVDFGLTGSISAKVPNGNKPLGTPYYLPNMTGIASITAEQLDVFALKRCLYMPEYFWYRDGHIDNNYSPSILNDFILYHYNLSMFVDTSSGRNENRFYNDDKIKAGSLAAILIAAKLKLSIDYKELAENSLKALVITGIYRANPSATKQEIEQSLQDEKAIRVIAAFSEMDQYENMNVFMADIDFSNAMETAKSQEQACSLILLKSQNLSNYACLANEDLAKAIYAIYQQPKKVWSETNILRLVMNPALAIVINQLSQQNLQMYFEAFFDWISISIGQLPDRNALAKLFDKQLSEDELGFICELLSTIKENPVHEVQPFVPAPPPTDLNPPQAFQDSSSKAPPKTSLIFKAGFYSLEFVAVFGIVMALGLFVIPSQLPVAALLGVAVAISAATLLTTFCVIKLFQYLKDSIARTTEDARNYPVEVNTSLDSSVSHSKLNKLLGSPLVSEDQELPATRSPFIPLPPEVPFHPDLQQDSEHYLPAYRL